MHRLLTAAALAWSAALVAAACRGEASPCGPAIREALDPQSGIHLLDTEGITYLTDPPTSGPHLGAAALQGIQEAPLPRPRQVDVLESGSVLVQYGDLDRTSVGALEALAAETVVVAPNPELTVPVVATAWLRKMECASVDTESLQSFVDEFQGRGPAHE